MDVQTNNHMFTSNTVNANIPSFMGVMNHGSANLSRNNSTSSYGRELHSGMRDRMSLLRKLDLDPSLTLDLSNCDDTSISGYLDILNQKYRLEVEKIRQDNLKLLDKLVDKLNSMENLSDETCEKLIEFVRDENIKKTKLDLDEGLTLSTNRPNYIASPAGKEDRLSVSSLPSHYKINEFNRGQVAYIGGSPYSVAFQGGPNSTGPSFQNQTPTFNLYNGGTLPRQSSTLGLFQPAVNPVLPPTVTNQPFIAPQIITGPPNLSPPLPNNHSSSGYMMAYDATTNTRQSFPAPYPALLQQYEAGQDLKVIPFKASKLNLGASTTHENNDSHKNKRPHLQGSSKTKISVNQKQSTSNKLTNDTDSAKMRP
ncbi:hypothetical protein KAFR_0J00920 [Kazachstania africana CBS 2517]|uniref:Uncharacterized protein n=1 Tax=Kazachstania africana (strain ATCC 22294 / BCRC 22015 / CBS 2517 / CECT 1963 / NBRC 1671 / NRRL Y-8276) TaxID=1071382 RepID=H2B0L0_KAZAF|nr:hypothetical protein KAFR_0J00920 [Kazachstania africana CBS 2517]CCF60160.1 hypothetical protein KAFR_0J00920 [Kazachstania africana CBS 2517]